jgi:hypothetical protein
MLKNFLQRRLSDVSINKINIAFINEFDFLPKDRKKNVIIPLSNMKLWQNNSGLL